MGQNDKKTQKIPFRMLISAYDSTDFCKKIRIVIKRGF